MTSISETIGRLVLFSRTPGTWLTVLNSSLRPVAAGPERLDLRLPAGVYHIESELGGTGATDLVSLAPGAEVQRDLTVEFPATAPVVGTSTANETHGDLASELSRRIADGVGPDAGLVLMLRNLRGFGQAPLAPNRVQLYDDRLRPVTGWSTRWTQDQSGGSLGQCGRFPPGPYLLRTESDTGSGEPKSTDQTVWLSPGYQTLVFVPNGYAGADARGASVHMMSLTEKWSRHDPRALALEEALAVLRDVDGIPLSAVDQWASVRKVDPAFPMTDLARLVGQLASGVGSPEVMQIALSRLQDALGNHPDVLAISAALGLRLRGASLVAWPPMFAVSYQGVLRASLYDTHVLPAACPAERVALYQRPSSPWLQWESTSDVLTSAPPREVFLEPTPGPFFPDPEEVRAPAVAVRRVAEVIGEIAAFNGTPDVIERLGSTELALRCGLPRALVEAALRELGTQSQVGSI